MVTQADIENLELALVSGVSEVREGNTWVKYASQAEMRKTIAKYKDELDNRRPSGVRAIRVTKGR